MKAYQALFFMFLYLVNGQKVRDMWYRSTEHTRVSAVWPDSCAFPCRAVDETYQSLEIGSVGKPCPNPLPLDYDLSSDISSGILVQKPCDLEEVWVILLISTKSAKINFTVYVCTTSNAIQSKTFGYFFKWFLFSCRKLQFVPTVFVRRTKM